MIKALRNIVIGLPIMAAALVAAPTSAGADLGDCPRSAFCAWAEDRFTGPWAYWYGSYPRWGDYGMHDDADSVFNNARSSTTVPDNVWVYYDVDYVSPSICVQPGETYDAGMNDNDYDSHKWFHSC
ncbi:peptidase inhibitor family I36 protein [Micromonospora sp. WMMD1155]|uniref:peptidase inhibitor family I36 protein n=1 Tax=Micromonospora sp. WMMD1155 TaxID=3016094 RepID=UPI00249A0537|nr:peptidase inhibitor family I36 protein [Micromonospora sp. WMMD1155]WFE53327.1 peptidase inhibitor family I36 protein [Micromonospora sp. WMMD1155]